MLYYTSKSVHLNALPGRRGDASRRELYMAPDERSVRRLLFLIQPEALFKWSTRCLAH